MPDLIRKTPQSSLHKSTPTKREKKIRFLSNRNARF